MDSETSEKQNNAAKSSFVDGQKLFAKKCASCHGRGGKGTDQGPPLIHKIYESSHHGDASFVRAAANGVQAHHWEFGNMPPSKELSESDMTSIIKYVRKEQKKVGIH